MESQELVRAVVLSHTEMEGDRFCTSVALERANGWEQVRLLDLTGAHPSTGAFAYPAQSIARMWMPGLRVRLPEPLRNCPRPTHPEDREVDLTKIRIDKMASVLEFVEIVDAFRFASASALFPNVRFQDNGKAYVTGEEPQPRSVGYVDCERIVHLPDDYVQVTTRAGEDLLCKLKAVGTLGRVRSGIIPWRVPFLNRTIRLGLANPSDWDGRFDPPRCYVMVTFILR